MKNPNIIDGDETAALIDDVYANILINQKRRRRKVIAFIVVASIISLAIGFCIGLNMSV
jgi:hypothetical protein